MDDSILSVVYESAKGLYESGIMDIETMEKIEAIYSSEIKKIRLKNKITQSLFAYYLNISASTIQKWERGIKEAGKNDVHDLGSFSKYI